MNFKWIVLAIVAVALAWFVSIYNHLIRLIEAIRNNEKQIDVQLDRRFKVFESLINVVKQAMDYEKTTLKDVVALRNQAQLAATSGHPQERMDAENAISRIASGISVIFEQYPELKATANAVQLQEEIVNTENKLAFAKQAYNDSIERYNAKKKSLLESLVVAIFRSKLDKEFLYWSLDDQTRQARESAVVKF